MKDEKVGIGTYHTLKSYRAQRIIFLTLFDGQWHRNKELKEKTKLSSRTLAKHLEHLIKNHLIERKEDLESGKYPIPVLYKAEPELLDFTKSTLIREEFANKIDAMIEETKDPLIILDVIHDFSQLAFLKLMQNLQENKDLNDEELEFYEEILLWANYKSFTFNLIEAIRRKTDQFDIKQLLEAQAERKKEISALLIKTYKEMGFVP